MKLSREKVLAVTGLPQLSHFVHAAARSLASSSCLIFARSSSSFAWALPALAFSFCFFFFSRSLSFLLCSDSSLIPSGTRAATQSNQSREGRTKSGKRKRNRRRRPRLAR